MSPQDFSRLAALFSLAALTACGGSDDDAPTEPPAPPPAPAPASFDLGISVDRALILQGRTATVTATVSREAGFDGAVQIALSGLPAGVTAAPVVVSSGATSATITLSASDAAPHALPTLGSVRGSADGQDGQVVDKPLTVTVGGLPGVVDTSFGRDAAALTEIGDGESYARGVAVQPDGSIVSVGYTTTATGGNDFAVVRHLRDGTLDPAFGTGGKVTTAIGADRGADQAYSVLIQPDGKIVVGGYSSSATTGQDFAVVRYLADGALDTSFGTGGTLSFDFAGETDRVRAMLLQADGRLVLGGDARTSAANGIDFALARLTIDGALDASFGTGGTVTTAFSTGGGRDSVYALALQTLGDQTRIVAAGGEGDFQLARYQMDGTLDGAFGDGGVINGLFGSTIGAAQAVLSTPQGQLVVAGSIHDDFALARLDAGGALDAGFGSGGGVVTPMSTTNWDRATAVVQQTDGRILVGGWVYEGNSSNGNFATARYTTDGALDPSFGSGGTQIHGVAAQGRSDSGQALVLQADERVPTVRAIQAGEASVGGFNRFALLRYWL